MPRFPSHKTWWIKQGWVQWVHQCLEFALVLHWSSHTAADRMDVQRIEWLYYSSHHYPHGTHFSNFIGRYSLSWLSLPTKSYTLVLHHVCLNASIPTFLLAPCDHPPPLTCTSLALIFISVHARFILQLQQSGILSLLLFVHLKP